MKLAFLIASLFLVPAAFSQDADAKKEAAKEPAGPGFEVTSMKCFSDKIINKASVGVDGVKIEGGIRIGALEGPGSELTDFTFPEDQKKQYFEFQFGPASGNKTISVSLKAVRTTLGANIGILDVSGKTDKNGKLPAEWNLKKNWPVGLYKAFFTCDGASVGTAGYLVKAVKDRETPIEATGVTILSFKDGKSTEKTKLTTADNDLNFKCATKGANTKGADVRMLVRVKGDKEQERILKGSEVKIDSWPLEDTEMIYSLELPDKFPAGDYDMVIFVNEEQLIAHPFSVTE